MDEDVLYDYFEQIIEDVERLRGLEIGQDLEYEFMNVPDFAYYRYLEDRKDRDDTFGDGLRLFLFGYGADEKNWTDPDVAVIAGSKRVAGLYEPENYHITITKGSASLWSFLLDVFEVMKSNDEGSRKSYFKVLDIIKNEKKSEDLSMRQTMYHELVHAAQDWNYDLLWLKDFVDDEFDFFLAMKALIEGDAVFSSAHFLCDYLGLEKVLNDEFFDVHKENQKSGKIKGGIISPIMEYDDPLGVYYSYIGRFPYSAGFLYVGHLHNQDSYRAIDNAFELRPTTTRQILHPRTDSEGLFDVNVIDFGASPEDIESYRLSELMVDENIVVDTTVGELGINALLGAFGVYERGSDPAEGWGGDRLRIYRDDNDYVVSLWYLTWETRESASRFFSAYQKVLSEKCTTSIRHVSSADAPLIESNLCGLQYLDIVGNDVILVETPFHGGDDDFDLVVDYAKSAQIETMTAAELYGHFMTILDEKEERDSMNE